MYIKRVSVMLVYVNVTMLCSVGGDNKQNKRKNDHRMYGSQDAADGQFPYVVFHMLHIPRGMSTCSGSIVSARWVLLAAHCVNSDANPRNHLIVAGKANLNQYLSRRYRVSFETNLNEAAYDVQERRAARIHYHPSHSRAGNNDVGLILLQRPFNINNRVAIVPLARDGMGGERGCVLAGYGVIENNQRKHVLQYISRMPARPAPQCTHQRTRDVICLADITRGICHGDSGGPLVCQGAQRGTASHGISRGSGSSCGVGTVEQYYTDTHLNMAWIDSVMSSQRNKNKT